ncbi:lipid II:glycine glycyltransferase FemX [Halobacteriaceae archaeon GCM10025711]
MGIDVRKATDDDLDRWNDYVDRSTGGTPFHRREALSVMAETSGADFHPLVGFKGQEPVGLLPAFQVDVGPVTAAFSPPPDLRIPYLGPVVLESSQLKQRKAERRHRRFVDGAVEWLGDAVAPRFVHFRTVTAYDDLRPLQWNGFEATPAHTYVVDLTRDRDDLLSSFSSDARQNIRSGEDVEYAVREGDVDDVRRIVDGVRRRYEEQGLTYGIDPSFVTALYRRLPDGVVRPYVCTVDGEYAGGMVTLESDDTIYRWQGAVDTSVDAPANDLLDWHIMRDAMDRDVAGYDMVGADTRRLNGYKAKFGPAVVRYHRMERASLPVRYAARLYQRLR